MFFGLKYRDVQHINRMARRCIVRHVITRDGRALTWHKGRWVDTHLTQ